ncbi:MAG TPA: FliM/FliN family flagellar motor switch protein, partial [Candidatus Acidoferrales bacterium]|nr:FliM/FliN family flagellar motor switch protein [Candidatus Acidoferrales bacterium]
VLKESWAEHLAMNPTIATFESNPEMLQITSGEDNVLVTNLEIHSVSFNGIIALCLPMASIEAFLQEKGAARPASRPFDTELAAGRALAEGSLRHAHVELVARFPTLWLTTRQLGELAPGAVLHTGQATEQPLEILINERLRFLGSLGQVRRQLGLCITERVQKPAAERPVLSRQGRVM